MKKDQVLNGKTKLSSDYLYAETNMSLGFDDYGDGFETDFSRISKAAFAAKHSHGNKALFFH